MPQQQSKLNHPAKDSQIGEIHSFGAVELRRGLSIENLGSGFHMSAVAGGKLVVIGRRLVAVHAAETPHTAWNFLQSSMLLYDN